MPQKETAIVPSTTAADSTLAAGLSSQQITAIRALAEGKNLANSADVAGVNRTTLYRWMRSHPAFIAAYNAWQSDVEQSARGRLLSLADAAVSAVTTAVESGDARTALAVLKGMGLLTPQKPGPDSPDQVREQLETESMKRDADTATAKSEAIFKKMTAAFS